MQRRIWDNLAEFWDRFQDESGDWYREYILHPLYLSIIESITKSQKRSPKILDIGCGTGCLSRKLSSYNIDVTGIDIAPKMILFAKKRTQNKHSFLQMDCCNLENLGSSVFDIAISELTVQALRQIDRFFQELSRVLRCSGIFIFSVEHPFSSLYSHVHVTTKRLWINKDKTKRNVRPIERYLMRSKEKVEWQPGLFSYRYHRPIEDYAKALNRNGFVITNLFEPIPSKGGRSSLTKFMITRKIPKFLVFETENKKKYK